MDGSSSEPPLTDDMAPAPAAPALDEALVAHKSAWKAALAAAATALALALQMARRRGRAVWTEARASGAGALQVAWTRGRAPCAALLLIAVMLGAGGSAQGSSSRASNLAAQALPEPAAAPSSEARPALSRGVTTPRATGAPSGSAQPAYTGSVGYGQGCPGGRAPKPAAWAIGSAGDYGAPRLSSIALTFDDGPSPTSSPAILSFLERTHTPATFFVLGQYARAYPQLIQREAADGFTIGIHTWSHPNMRLLTPAQRAWQLTATIQQLRADLGPDFCVWLWRPPYESFDTSIVRQAGSLGLTTILWNVDPADWARPGVTAIVSRVLAHVRPGSIILMHDGPADRQQTAAALPYILAGLRQRGLTPVSLPQLLLGYQPSASSPGVTSAPTATPYPTVAPSSSATPSPAATPYPSPTATLAAAIAPAPAAAPTPGMRDDYSVAPHMAGQRLGGWSQMWSGG